ncbi:flavin-containing amine oxidoreductase-domain containing protein [Entophlyctis helioformis]|nr:flavin-containing amine oxidoreductase-domain containing protein [Entophlyctis helioformis]
MSKYAYLRARNWILALWLSNAQSYLSLAVVNQHAHELEDAAKWDLHIVGNAFRFLDRHRYINFGLISDMPPSTLSAYQLQHARRPKILIVGAGIAGLSTAREILNIYGSFPHLATPEILILEASKRVGGRILTTSLHTTRKDDPSHPSAVDLGPLALTGFSNGNPLDVVINAQLQLPVYQLASSDECILVDINGKEIAGEPDTAMDNVFNNVLDVASRTLIRNGKKEVVKDDEISRWKLDVQAGKIKCPELPSLGQLFDHHLQQHPLYPMLKPAHMRIIQWHLATEECSQGADVRKVSALFWSNENQEFSGKPYIVSGGLSQITDAYAESMTSTNSRLFKILYNKSVCNVTVPQAKNADPSSFQPAGHCLVHCADGTRYDADVVVMTVPLGVLKRGHITFQPELPAWKAGAIKRLGMGVFNKVVLTFPSCFWDATIDSFGSLVDPSDDNPSVDVAQPHPRDYANTRGRFFMFWNLYPTTKLPVLVAGISGRAAVDMESMSNEDIIALVMRQLTRLFTTKAPLPLPRESYVTRWGQSEFSFGSGSYVANGASKDDYRMMAVPCLERIFWAGEATSSYYPSSVHGAMLSGEHVATAIADTFLGPVTYKEPAVHDLDCNMANAASLAGLPCHRAGCAIQFGHSESYMDHIQKHHSHGKQVLAPEVAVGSDSMAANSPQLGDRLVSTSTTSSSVSTVAGRAKASVSASKPAKAPASGTRAPASIRSDIPAASSQPSRPRLAAPPNQGEPRMHRLDVANMSEAARYALGYELFAEEALKQAQADIAASMSPYSSPETLLRSRWEKMTRTIRYTYMVRALSRATGSETPFGPRPSAATAPSRVVSRESRASASATPSSAAPSAASSAPSTAPGTLRLGGASPAGRSSRVGQSAPGGFPPDAPPPPARPANSSYQLFCMMPGNHLLESARSSAKAGTKPLTKGEVWHALPQEVRDSYDRLLLKQSAEYTAKLAAYKEMMRQRYPNVELTNKLLLHWPTAASYSAGNGTANGNIGQSLAAHDNGADAGALRDDSGATLVPQVGDESGREYSWLDHLAGQIDQGPALTPTATKPSIGNAASAAEFAREKWQSPYELHEPASSYRASRTSQLQDAASSHAAYTAYPGQPAPQHLAQPQHGHDTQSNRAEHQQYMWKQPHHEQGHGLPPPAAWPTGSDGYNHQSGHHGHRSHSSVHEPPVQSWPQQPQHPNHHHQAYPLHSDTAASGYRHAPYPPNQHAPPQAYGYDQPSPYHQGPIDHGSSGPFHASRHPEPYPYEPHGYPPYGQHYVDGHPPNPTMEQHRRAPAHPPHHIPLGQHPEMGFHSHSASMDHGGYAPPGHGAQHFGFNGGPHVQQLHPPHDTHPHRASMPAPPPPIQAPPSGRFYGFEPQGSHRSHSTADSHYRSPTSGQRDGRSSAPFPGQHEPPTASTHHADSSAASKPSSVNNDSHRASIRSSGSSIHSAQQQPPPYHHPSPPQQIRHDEHHQQRQQHPPMHSQHQQAHQPPVQHGFQSHHHHPAPPPPNLHLPPYPTSGSSSYHMGPHRSSPFPLQPLPPYDQPFQPPPPPARLVQYNGGNSGGDTRPNSRGSSTSG